MHALVVQPGAFAGHEKAGRDLSVQRIVPPGGVVGELGDGGRVQREQAVFTEFGVGDGQLPAGQVDIAGVEQLSPPRFSCR